jgi:hypothetical protein
MVRSVAETREHLQLKNWAYSSRNVSGHVVSGIAGAVKGETDYFGDDTSLSLLCGGDGASSP